MNITLEKVLEMWKDDCQINQSSLDGATVKNAILHQKYLEMLSHIRLKHKKREQELQTLMKDKFLYYTGKMTQQEMDERGWPYDPFNGSVKPLKGDMDLWFNSDKDIQDMKLAIEYLKVLFETIEECLENIKWRHQHIRNILDWRKFSEGA
jgi:hypothetical protein